MKYFAAIIYHVLITFVRSLLSMLNRSATYRSLVRCSWFTLAVILVIFCGPVKRLIELRLDDAGITPLSQTIDKKLHTCYRERREIAQAIHFTVSEAPDAGLPLFIATAFFLLSLLFRSARSFSVQPIPLSAGKGLPLYLYIRKLQV